MVYDIIVIGAGAAGLIAALDLSKAGRKVLMLEARDRIGGRAYTISNNKFTKPVEAGAEFVHGKLPVSLSLLKEAGLAFDKMQGKSYTIKEGKLKKENDFDIHWDELMQKLFALESDMNIAAFLNSYFEGEKYSDLHKSVIQFVQGFDAADPQKASALSLRNEWANDDDDDQFRIKNGYAVLMEWLTNTCINNRAELQLEQVVSNINHAGELVQVSCTNGTSYQAEKVLITIPLGVWQQENAFAHIRFTPALPEKNSAAAQMGFGNVVKVNIEFDSFIWVHNDPQSMPGAGFIFSDAIFPTWWTQNPSTVAQLSGWLAGPPAADMNNKSALEIEQIAFESLAYILNLPVDLLRSKTIACRVTNWANDPFALGGYSYETLQSNKAKKIMMQPVNGRLFFAGEAFYEGSHNGTVEAAFVSGRRAAKELL